VEISPVSTSASMTAITRQLSSNMTIQTEVMKTIAEGQEQMAAMLQAIGVGQNVDIQA
jgi:hypothetical protein